MLNNSAIFVLALIVGVPLTPTVVAAQSPKAPETTSPIHVRIEVDEDALGDGGVGLDTQVAEQMKPAFEEGGIQLVETDQTDALLLRIRIGGKAEDVELFDFQLHFELIDGKTATRLIEPVHCGGCFDHVLYETLVKQVPALIDAIEAELRAETGDTPPSGDGDGDSSEPPPKAIGPVGFAGIGVSALGIGVTIGGAVGLSLGLVEQRPGDFYDRTVTNHRPPGYALLGVGVGATVAGLVMIGVDVGRRAKQRKQRPQQAVVVPLMSPTSAGVGVVGRF